MAEIKEIKDQKLKEDDMILAIAAGSRHPISPHLDFEFSDPEVHEDLYKFIKYSCKEVCSTEEQLNKVLRFWTTFLEPMFGVTNRLHGSEAADDDILSKHHGLKRNGTSIGDSDGSPSMDASTTKSKKSKVVCNGDAKCSPQRLNSSRISVANTDAHPKEDGLAADGEHLISSDAAASLGADNVCARSESTSGIYIWTMSDFW